MPDWWTEFFDDDYAAVGLAHEPAELIERAVDFIVRMLELRPGQTVFDQCCGIGRISIPLARRGIRITGIDLTQSYVDIARRRAADESLPCEFHLGDAFRFVAPQSCDAAINWFTSFSYSSDDAMNERQLQNVFDSLKPGGRFLMDFLNVARVMAEFRPAIVNRSPAAAGDGLIVLQEPTPDFVTGMLESDWTFFYPDGHREVRHIATKMYLSHEIVQMLRRRGFSDFQLFGSIDGEPFERMSKRLIVRARRPA
jgi:SAM-dependent methyltransferase